MRTGIAVPLFLVAAACSPDTDVGDSGVLEVQKQLESTFCHSTLYECANTTPASCRSLAESAFVRCPTNKLASTIGAAVDGAGSDTEVVREAEEYGVCFSEHFQELASLEGIPLDCIVEAATDANERQKVEARKTLKNHN